MKKIILIHLLVVINGFIIAQAPDKFSYQAVIRDNNDQLVQNTSIGMQISILQGSTSGTDLYVERQFPTTNVNGLVTIEIGGGTVLLGNFSNIDWAIGNYFIKTETDLKGGSSYTITGISQLLSVPYALHAKKAEIVDYNNLTNQPNFAAVATSGNYSDLMNLPILFNGAWATLTDKPSTIAGYGITDAVSLIGDQIIDGKKTFAEMINVSNKPIINLADPVNEHDAATKAYVDILMERIKALESLVLTVKDIEGNDYRTVVIGTQVWMAENLRTTKYNNGETIPNVTNNNNWTSLTTGAYCYYNNDPETYLDNYGPLYNYYTVVDIRKLCPAGWHVPTNEEWSTLTTNLGGANLAGNKLKETGSAHWIINSSATNETGFTAIPGGYRSNEGLFNLIGSYGIWWSSTDYGDLNAFNRSMYYTSSNVADNGMNKFYGCSIRCLKD